MNSKSINLLTIIFLSIAIGAVADAQNIWTQTNGPYGGNGAAIAIDSTGNIFAGFTAGGIFRSTDRGGRWEPLRNGLLPSRFTSIAVNSANVIFAATTELWNDTDYVYISTDHGNNWRKSNKGIYYEPIRELRIAPNDHLFARLDFQDFRSTDNGGTWSEITPRGTHRQWGMAIGTNGYIYVANDSGLYRSTNEGASWNLAQRSSYPVNYSVFATRNGDIYTRDFIGALFRSSDSGATFQKISSTTTNDLVYGIATDTIGTILLGTSSSNLLRSTDRGASWNRIRPDVDSLIIWSIASDREGNFYLTSGAGGILTSTDRGATWVPSNAGLAATQIPSIIVASDGSVLAGGIGHGIYRTTNGGAEWQLANDGLRANYVYSLIRDNENRIIAGGYPGIFSSADNGLHWREFSAGLSGESFRSLSIDNAGEIIASTSPSNAIYRSSNNRTAWKRLDSGLLKLNKHAGSIIQTGSGALIAGTGEGIFRSTDDGASWTQAGATLGKWPVRGFAVDQRTGMICARLNVFMARSTDDGATWTTFGPTNQEATTISFDPQGRLYYATEYGIWRSTDSGKTATDISGIIRYPVSAIAFDRDGYAYAGSAGAGVYRTGRLPNSTAPSSAAVIDRSITSYPNPSSGETIIGFTLHAASHVRLSICDIRGAGNALSVDERMEKGYHEIPFDAGTLPPGIYSCTIYSDTEILRGKMVVTR